MSEHIKKRHNKTVILYHLVFPVKYRREALNENVIETLKEICLEISKRYEIYFIEIGAEDDHIHFLVQSVPSVSVEVILRTIKSITAREIFRRHPEVKTKLWGGNLWTYGYYANTVGHYASEEVIRKYVKNQGKEYNQIYKGQLVLFFDKE